MKPSEELFISVLKCAFTKQNCNVKVSLDSDEMKEAFHLAEINALPAFFYEGLLYVSENPTEKLVVTAKLAKITANAAERYNRYKKNIELLAENGVELITMKGFVVRKYYPVPEYRAFGDVDVLVKDDAVAKRVLSKAGFKEVQNELHVTGMKNEDQYFEVHKCLLSDDSFVPQGAKHLVKAAWNYTKPGSIGGTLEFTEEFHLFYLILHIAKHFYCMGAGVRMFLDIALILKTGAKSIDFNTVAEYLSLAELCRFAGCVLYLCKRFFDIELPVIEGVSEHITELEKDCGIAEELATYVIRGGVFGFSGPVYEVARLRCAYIENSEAGIAKSKVVAQSFFPSRKAMEGRYPFCRNKPFLLPVAHIVRVFSVLINRRRAKSAVIRLQRLCDSEESAKKQVEFYSKIGL